ncbi:MAG: outer membrane protein assembly factor BamA [Elusimicrobia bacterium CG1_02_63_36]|nr:MAG: outer membrane protein assembly factor BamA [Elusimicrobia bacterium CG1_02_63_36]PIP82701.1 MAG: outer membrane protein assembly factor BamA [Elusimicrobia bacterium CG22_combo_CG10-13_8_21_14_all_63_91]PJA11944.1 MAG: outer membrane protein assembly factor BamA [Elusimicrobia bacterium CG_4_10_14_0_2_um_filter_63_34]PJB23811.1 MAG: outer membrane protein assembly factor BamA [Elusimicrobia bacterium CG_4_9_14_3_um_filter_62_55]
MIALRKLAFFLIFAAFPLITSAQAPVQEDAAANSSQAPTEVKPQVVQIMIYGLESVPESRVQAMLKGREFKPYSAEDKAADFSMLLGSGLFTSVKIKEVPLSETALRLDIELQEGTPLAAGIPKTEEEKAAEALGATDPEEIPSPPWVVGEIDIQTFSHGKTKTVKPNTIRSQIKVRKGDLYERGMLDRDIQSVLNLGNFERVAADITVLRDRRVPEHFQSASPSPHPIKLVFMVEEKPLIKDFRFEGRKRLSKGRLLDAVEMEKKDPFDRVKLRADEQNILEEYRKRGFHRATIEASVLIDSDTLTAIPIFTIVEGPKAKLAPVRWTGVSAFKSKKLAKKAKMENRKKKVLNRKELSGDLKKVEEYYKNRGYLDFKVLSSSVSFNEDETLVYLDVAVEEGRAYRFGDTTFSGHTLYASTDLAKALEYRRKKVFSQEKFELTIHEIQSLYAENGRLRAQVTPTKTFNEETALMDVHFDVLEGPPVYVDNIDVEGFKATKKYVFTRELAIKRGQLFQVSKIKKSMEKIRNLGFIDDVGLDVQSPYDPEKVDLTFEIFEGKPGMLTAGAGFSSLDGLLGTLSLQHLNLFGRAWRTKASWSFGARVNDYSMSWTQLWTAGKPISLGFDVFNTRRINPFESSSNGFISKRTGGTVRLGPRFQDDTYSLNFNYTFQQVSISNVDRQFTSSLADSTSVQSTVGLEAARDSRDNIWDPASGSRHALGFSVSGGPLRGNIHLFKPYVTNALHATLFKINDWPAVVTLANRAGYVTPFNQTKVVPVFERYFIGGQDTLRGYSAIGEAGYRNGGKAWDVANVEFGFPLARERKKTIVKFVTFFDIGGSWDNARSIRGHVGQDEHDLKSDVGFGIRFTTPAFPIRLDWGYGLQHRPGESKTQINFGIGSLF